MKKVLIGGIISAVLSFLAAVLYLKVYSFFLAVDFSEQIKTFHLVLCFLFTGLAIATSYYALKPKFKRHTDRILNPILVVVSFATVVIPFIVTLPLEVEQPELFPGMVAPLHFFPALSWLLTKPYLLD